MEIIKRFFSTMVWCLSLSWGSSRFYTIARLGIEVIVPILTIATSFVGKYIFNLLAGAWQVDDPTMTLLYLFAGLLVLALLSSGFQKLLFYYQTIHNDLVRNKIALMMMERALSSDLAFFDDPGYHDQLMAATRDSEAIVNVVWGALSGISAFIASVSAFVLLSQANIIYSLLVIVAAAPSSMVSAKYIRSLYELSLEQINSERKVYYYQNIAVDRHYAQDMRLFNAGGWLRKRYELIWNELFNSRKSMIQKRTILTTLLECLPEIAIAGIGIDIALRVIAGNATVGEYSLYIGLVGQLLGSIFQFSTGAMQIYDNQLKIENIRALEGFKNKILDKGKKHLNQVNTITFEHVSFSYPGTKMLALDDVMFHLHRGEKIAFVGLNGSGKSTLIKLLLRLYDPDSGVIQINGIDIRDYTIISLRENFSVYFQDTQNYCFTLKENLVIADVSQEESEVSIQAALQASLCDDILNRAPKGIDTGLTRYFDPDGIELSGGQHQKLALARALYRRHTALILDEPSSNLDPRAEHQIFLSLKSLADHCMTIFTSHRLSNVFLADRIIVLEKGRVVEDGTQEELLRNRQRYAELFNYQKEKFISDS